MVVTSGTQGPAAAGTVRRGRVRPSRTAPGPDPTLAALDLASLRERRAALTDEAERASYWRRVVQARLDLLLPTSAVRRGDGTGPPVVERVARALADPASALRRRAVAPRPLRALEPPALDGLGELLGPLDPSGEVAVERVTALGELEERLSAYRARLHVELDRLTAELVCRYHRDPASALVALPRVPDPRGEARQT